MTGRRPVRRILSALDKSHAWLPFAATVFIRLLCLDDFLASPFFLPLGGDRGLYHRAALAIFQGPGVTEVFSFLPLYAYLIGGLYRLIGGPNLAAAAILQALLDGLSAQLIASLARRRYGAPAGWLAGLGFALCGLAAAYALVTTPLTLGLFWTALTASASDRWQHRWTFSRAILMGLLLGGGGQILGAFWLMLAPFSLWIGLESDAHLRRRLAMGLLVMLGGAACLLPTLAHNVLHGRQWVPVTAHGGLNIYMGNNPAGTGYGTAIPGMRISAEEMTRDSISLAARLSGRPLGPAEADRFWRRQAWDFWRQQPLTALALQGQKIHRLVSIRDFDDTGVARLLPKSARALRWTIVGFGSIWLLACAGYGLRPAQNRNPGLWIMGLGFAAGMMITFVTARYRLPLAILLLPAAGATLASLPKVLSNARRGINWRWAAGLLGIGLALCPHPLPDVSLADNLAQASRWIQSGNASKAMAFARMTTLQHPNSAEAWFGMGNACLAQDDDPAALRAYAYATKLQPDRTDILFNAGRALERLGRPHEARNLYEHIVELDPENSKAWFSLAVLERQAGERERARESLAEAARSAGWNHPDIIAFWSVSD